MSRVYAAVQHTVALIVFTFIALALIDVYASKGEYGLVSCRPDAGACLLFDAQRGEFLFVPLPKLPAMPGTETQENS